MVSKTLLKVFQINFCFTKSHNFSHWWNLGGTWKNATRTLQIGTSITNFYKDTNFWQDMVFIVKLHLGLIPYPLTLTLEAWGLTLDPYPLTFSTVPLRKFRCEFSIFHPLKVFFHERPSSILGRLPSKVVFIEGCLPSKIIFHRRSSSITGLLAS